MGKRFTSFRSLAEAAEKMRSGWPTRPQLSDVSAEEAAQRAAAEEAEIGRAIADAQWAAEEVARVMALPPPIRRQRAGDLRKLEDFVLEATGSQRVSEVVRLAFRDHFGLRLVEVWPAVTETEEEDGRVEVAHPELVWATPPGAERRRSLIDYLTQFGVGEVVVVRKGDPAPKGPAVQIGRNPRSGASTFFVVRGEVARRTAQTLDALIERMRRVRRRNWEDTIRAAVAENPKGFSVKRLLGGEAVEAFTFRVGGELALPSGKAWSCPQGGITVMSDGKLIAPVEGFGGLENLVAEMVECEAQLSTSEAAGTGRVTLPRGLSSAEFERRLRLHLTFRSIIHLRKMIEEEMELARDFCVGEVGRLRKSGDITIQDFFLAGKPGRVVLDDIDMVFRHGRTHLHAPVLALERRADGTIFLEAYRRRFEGKYIADPGPEVVFGNAVGKAFPEGVRFEGVLKAHKALGRLLRVFYARVRSEARAAEQAAEARARVAAEQAAAEAARDAKYASEAAEAERLLAEAEGNDPEATQA